MATDVTRYSERIKELLTTMSVEDLRDLTLTHLNAIRGLQYSIDRLNLDNERLKKSNEKLIGDVNHLGRKLAEADRTTAFYRYHKGAKS